MVMFFKMVNLASTASRAVFRAKFPMKQLSDEDNHQRFNLEASRALGPCTDHAPYTLIPTLKEPVRQNISTVLKTLMPAETSAPKRTKKDDTAPKRQKRCHFCPAKHDCKTKSICNGCHHHICQEHSRLSCLHC